jgi:hypothetical protein
MAKLTITRGTTYTIGLNYQRSGVATSLVGATVRFTMKSAEYDTDTDDSDASVIKNVTTGDADGAATITINPSDTATLTPGKYYYDIKVQESGGSIYKVDEGTVVLDGSPTNRLS